MTYDEAVTALYQAPVEGFVAERKRLANELKTEGDKSGATKLAKLGRPTLSAWAVNQLWWHARDAFDKLFETAEQIRNGELAAQAPHREALATLRGRAARMLTDGGHNANEGTLRRATTTLSALAASGSWSPDAPGSIAEDREPIGFDVALALANVPVRSAPTPHAAKPAAHKPAPQAEPEDADVEEEEVDDEEEHARRDAAQRELESKPHEPAPKKHELTSVPAHDHEAEKKKKEHDEAKRRAHEEAEKKKAEDKVRAAKAAERSKLIANLATAQSELARRHKVVTQLAEQLGIAEQQVAEAEDIVAALQAKLEEHA